MAVRKTVDYLTQQFAETRGVSPDNAVRIALMEALAREQERAEEDEEVASHESLIEAIDARRLVIAGIFAEEAGLDRIGSEVLPPMALAIVWLVAAVFAAFFVRPLLFAMIGIILLFVVFAYLTSRSVEKRCESGRHMREALALEIKELGKRLPNRLSFLANVPNGDPYSNLITLEGELVD